jgi:type II secretory ATPase GspE/PulE/Tfp pilus assembly ATPase PilB-like protein
VSESLSSHDTAEKLAQHVPIIKMVDTVIDRALKQNASDIHLEPTTDRVIIRFRIDGMLHKIVELPHAVLPPLVARLKLMANLKLDEYRLPQDGRFRVSFNEREVAIRISAIPTLHGTKMVLRLLDTKERQFALGKLGLNSNDLAIIKREIAKPHGMVLVTGPTGSGKTTTLYAFLKLLHRENVNICTVEDPIEYGIEGINQMQINPVVNLGFAAGLRSLLRQDPDIVMVGEIRDSETAEMAINAAMTGHLVLSTLHTNSAFLAVQRLIEMGVAPFQIGSVVNMVVGQRLVRKICGHCAERLPSSHKALESYAALFNLEEVFAKLQRLGLVPPPNPPLWEVKLSRGRGCARCSGTGYQGRIGIYELLAVDRVMEELITAGSPADAIKQAALKQGTLTMAEDGVLKVLQGLTTFDEVLRVTKE